MMFLSRMREDTKKALTVTSDDLLKEKIVIFSDIHRGDGGKKDHFKDNEDIYINALDYYLKKNFNLVLAGDIEEGWGYGHRMEAVIQCYRNTALKKESEFHKKNQYYRLYGNHDDYWLKQENVDNFLRPALGNKGIKVYPAIFFKDNQNTLLVIHGCQGHPLHDVGDVLAKEVVKTNYGTHYEDPPKPYEGKRIDYQTRLRRQEIYLLEWAMKRGVVMVGAHSHMPYFRSSPVFNFIDKEIKKIKASKTLTPLEKETNNDYFKKVKEDARIPFRKRYQKLINNPPPVYFNSGCCTGADMMTVIEIDKGIIRLVEWNPKGRTTKNLDKLESIFNVAQKIKTKRI
ncbi:MAG: hypothetical protein KAT17_10520 [Candidatus Aminicenantes bacterium]|nr:hypothetical protein [Candidatus Aminicenantes bacterium]